MSERRTPTTSIGIPSESGDIADRGDNALSTGSIKHPPTALTCPQCGGAIWEQDDGNRGGGGGGPLFYRCHVGHAYTADTMAAEHESMLEQTLWAALRMFQENAALHRRMAAKAEHTQPEMAPRFRERAEENEARTELIRKILLGETGPAPAELRA